MTDRELVMQYRYAWRSERRSMTVTLNRTVCVCTDDADGDTVDLTWDGVALTGDLSDTRRREIAALLTAAMQPI